MKQLTLGKEELEFLRTFLREGNLLGQEAAGFPEDGSVVTWLPDDLEFADVSLREGLGLEGPPTENIWSPLLDLTLRFLRADPTHIAIAEAWTERASILPDWIRFNGFDQDFSYFVCEGSSHRLFHPETRVEYTDLVTVYGFLSGTEATAGQVSELIDAAFPFHEIYLLTSLLDGKTIEPAASLEKSDLRTLASQAEHIAVGAYDGSGVVLWSRNSGSKPRSLSP
jgi:hypothetical protein